MISGKVFNIMAVCASLLLFSVLFVFVPYKPVIAFYYEDEEKLLAYAPLNQSRSFQMKYTHSIHLSDVVETYRFSGKQIIQTELAYQDFAVGMPSNAEGQEVFEEKDGTYYIKNMNRPFPFIDVRIGQVKANHRLLYGDHTYTLSNYLKAGSWVRISFEKLTAWQQWKATNIVSFKKSLNRGVG